MQGRVVTLSRVGLIAALSVSEWAQRCGRGRGRWHDSVLPARVGGRGRGITRVVGLLLVAGLVLGAAPPAAAAVVTHDGGDVPFYARISAIGHPDQIFEDGSWVAIVFYRPAHCVPDHFDLLTFFDFGAFSCGPPTTDGFNVWQNGPGLDPAPMLAVTHGLGAVPVWFVRSGRSFESALAGGLLMSELRAMEPVTGTAEYFRQVLQPHDAAIVPMTSFVASGTLDHGGGPFRVHGLFIEGVTVTTHITGLPPSP